MIDISRMISKFEIEKPKIIKMLLQVHDELIFEVKEEFVEEAIVGIKKIMEEVVKLNVSLIVEVKTGKNWGKMDKM